eukprot:52453_1
MSHQSSAESHDEVEEKSVLGKRTQLSPTSNQATPPPKRRRTTQWNQIFESRSTNNSKKKTKKKKKKSQLPKVSKSKEIKAVETKFMALPVNQKTLILNPSIQNDTSQFETMAGMCGFKVSEQEILLSILKSHLSDISVQEKDTQQIIFNPQPPIEYERIFKQQWCKASSTIMAVQKRLLMKQLHDIKIGKTYLQSLTKITNVQLDAIRKINQVKLMMQMPSIRSKNNKTESIEDTLRHIKQTSSQYTSTNRLCDQLIEMKNIVCIAINELNAEITSINEILIKVRLCSFNQGTRIHLKDKLITGEYVKRAPKLVSIFVNLISKLEDIKSEFIDKKQSIEDIFKNKKIKNIENRAEKMTVAKENDKKRHEERKKKEEKEFGGSTAGLNANESDDELRVEN